MKIFDIAFHGVSTFNLSQIERTRHFQGTFEVHAQVPAFDAIKAAQEQNARLIFVVNDDDAVSGIVMPGSLKQRIENYRGVLFETLPDALLAMQEDPLEISRGFQHEWLNSERPKLHWCSGGHMTDESPCSIHGLR